MRNLMAGKGLFERTKYASVGGFMRIELWEGCEMNGGCLRYLEQTGGDSGRVAKVTHYPDIMDARRVYRETVED